MTPTPSRWQEATAPLWRNSMPFAQLVGLCPLLAVSTTLVAGLALGLATVAVVVLVSTAMALLRPLVSPATQLPIALALLAGLVTAIDFISAALLYDLHEVLGLFIPLIVVNTGILAHTREVAAHRGVGFTFVSSLATGLGFLFALLALGALREALGAGTVLGGVEMLGGEGSRSLTIHLPWSGMLVAVLPPGAFFGMALLLALRQRLTSAPEARQTQQTQERSQ